jgi:serine/threonine-protein kinase
VRTEATTIDAPSDLVRTIGRGAVPDSIRQRDGSRYYAGEVIADKYRLTRAIARGGMGEVWLGVHESLKTEVAIKFSDDGIRTDPYRSAVILERFLFEARVSARLGSRTKHIVAVLDAGTYDGIPYLVMEYVPGKTLDDTISKTSPLTPDRLAVILDQIADALDVAHGLGVIHRDIKPSNVMIVEDNGRVTVKVADFGVAKVVRPDLALERPKETPPNSIIGSPAYMSPEQMRASGPVDLRSDLWSLGVLAFEALTAHLPFSGRTMADLIVSISTHQTPSLATMRPELGTRYDRWVARALAKDPAKRFGSAREMAAAFRAAMIDEPRKSTPRLLLLGGLLATGSMVVTLAILMTGSQPPAKVAPSSPQEPESAAPPGPTGPTVEPLGPPSSVSVVAPTEPAKVMAVPPASAEAVSPADAKTAEPSASAATSVRPKPTAPKPPRPPKEFDRSEIQ